MREDENLQKVVVNKSALDEKIKEFEYVRDFEVPELKENDVVPVFRVKAASLDDHITARKRASAPMTVLLEFIGKIRNKEEFDVKDIEKRMFKEDMDVDTHFEINVFQRCVIEPKFRLDEVVALSGRYPALVNRVVKFALNMNAENE